MKTEKEIQQLLDAHKRRLNQLSRQVVDCVNLKVPLASLQTGYDDTILRIKELEWVLD